MALDSTITKTAITNFVNGIGTSGNALDTTNLVFNRTVSKKFVKMLGKVKSKTATIGTDTYTLTAPGAVAMFEMLDESAYLAPSYNENGALEINSDKSVDTVVIGGQFVSTPPTVNAEGKIVKKGTNTVAGKNIIITDDTFTDYAYHTFTPSDGGKVVLEGVAVDGSEGKLCAGKGPNTPLVFKSDGAIVIREMTETATNDSTTKPQLSYNSAIYNGLEIWGHQKADGTWGNPTSILIEDCNFVNSFSNNAINIFGMANGAKALIKNCVFDGASNILRIGSVNTGFQNSYNCVIEFRDCQFKSWDTDAIWGAFALCEFDEGTKNIYGTDDNGTHITIKIVNCTGPDGQKIQPFANQGDVCGPNVLVKNIVDGNEIVSTYANGTQLLVDGTATDVSGRAVVDTQHRLLIMWDRSGKTPASTDGAAITWPRYGAKFVPWEGYENWFPTLIVE